MPWARAISLRCPLGAAATQPLSHWLCHSKEVCLFFFLNPGNIFYFYYYKNIESKKRKLMITFFNVSHKFTYTHTITNKSVWNSLFFINTATVLAQALIIYYLPPHVPTCVPLNQGPIKEPMSNDQRHSLYVQS